MIDQASLYPDPYTILPNSPHLHTDTLICLHGTSTSGPELAGPLLSTSFMSPSSQSTTTLPLLFPSCKLIFPTGALNPTTVFNGKETHAWFDIHSFADRTIGEDSLTFRRGMRASVRYLTALIKAEVEIVGRQQNGKSGKVVLWGFSQGAAMAIILLLSGELERAGIGLGFGAVVGMSGWLPLRSQIDETIKGAAKANEYVDKELKEKRERVRSFVRGYLELDDYGDGNSEVGRERKDEDDEWLNVPTLLGHGKIDEKVRVEWGLQMADVLTELGLNIQRKAYDGLAHWWNEEEIAGISEFLEKIWTGDTGNTLG